MKKVLVTGGAGFIGSHCVDWLLDAKHQVVVFDKKSVAQANNLQHCMDLITYVSADLADYEALLSAMSGCDSVIHLAAFVSVPGSIEQPVPSHQDNVTGTHNVFACMSELGVAAGVYASSAAVYGIPATTTVSESTATKPCSPYGLHKAINEQYAALYRDCFDLTLTGLRFFNVYGPRQDASSPYSGVISIFADKLRQGEPIQIFGDGAATRDFVYVGDVARICGEVATSTNDMAPIYNVATGVATSISALAAAMTTTIGMTADIQYRPARAGDITDSQADIKLLKEAVLTTPATSLDTGLHKLLTLD